MGHPTVSNLSAVVGGQIGGTRSNQFASDLQFVMQSSQG